MSARLPRLEGLDGESQGPRPVHIVTPNKVCHISLAAVTLGYSVIAMRHKIAAGMWAEGVHWHRAPDGRVFIDLPAVTKWVEGTGA